MGWDKIVVVIEFKQRKCGNCGTLGHTKTKCKKPPKLLSTVEKSKGGRSEKRYVSSSSATPATATPAMPTTTATLVPTQPSATPTTSTIYQPLRPSQVIPTKGGKRGAEAVAPSVIICQNSASGSHNVVDQSSHI